MGEGEGGMAVYGRSSLVFADGVATFDESDVRMSAAYTCSDGILEGEWRHVDYVGTVLTAEDGRITVYWDGELYEPASDATVP